MNLEEMLTFLLLSNLVLQWHMVMCHTMIHNAATGLVLRFTVTHHLPVFLSLVDSDVLHIGGKPFIEPQVIPPRWRHQVTKPLKQAHYSERGEERRTGEISKMWNRVGTWWANSCDTTTATLCLLVAADCCNRDSMIRSLIRSDRPSWVYTCGSYSRAVSR